MGSFESLIRLSQLRRPWRRRLGGFVHRAHLRHQRVVGLGQDATTLVDVVAVEPHDQRLVRLVAEHLQRRDDAVGHRVARGDAAEHVDEHALDLLVAQDDVQAGGHHLGRRAAADVEEVGRLDAAVLLAGVGDDVERRHHQARAVADDADLAVELDVVEVVLLGLELERVGGVPVLELDVAGLAEVGVRVEGDLAVERQDLSSGACAPTGSPRPGWRPRRRRPPTASGSSRPPRRAPRRAGGPARRSSGRTPGPRP